MEKIWRFLEGSNGLRRDRDYDAPWESWSWKNLWLRHCHWWDIHSINWFKWILSINIWTHTWTWLCSDILKNLIRFTWKKWYILGHQMSEQPVGQTFAPTIYPFCIWFWSFKHIEIRTMAWGCMEVKLATIKFAIWGPYRMTGYMIWLQFLLPLTLCPTSSTFLVVFIRIQPYTSSFISKTCCVRIRFK